MNALALPPSLPTVPYRVPRFRGAIELKLDGNEGQPPSPTLFDELEDRAALLSRYPDAGALEADLAARHRVTPEQVIVTAGADDGLDRVCRAVLGPDREVVLPVPTFEMIARYARMTGARVREVPWPRAAFPAEAVVAATTARTALICVVSPNNPTGAVATPADLARLSAAAPEAVLLVDAAYGELADEDLTQAALGLPRTVVTRTLSKAWGLAGLRVGYAIVQPQLVAALRAAGHPYPVAAPSLQLARARLASGGPDMGRYVAQVRRERRLIFARLAGLGLAAEPSQANFVFVRSRRAAWLRDGLGALGIAVRGWSGGSLADALRITCPGDEAACARLLGGIDTVLRPEALLFDMDGVLADVGRSYRQAIVATAASFGVALDGATIARAKLGGDANNDWRLTQKLMAQRGVDRPLVAVVERFEAAYLGDASSPGLCDQERMLPSRERLEGLAGRLPLGIVTGRPRAQAQVFLRRHGLTDLFASVVAMEDGPVKPSPGPVRLALEQLGVGRAWMIGDTPDDLAAARRAGVVPLGFAGGVAAPYRAEATDRLLDDGAARVLESLDELEELLP